MSGGFRVAWVEGERGEPDAFDLPEHRFRRWQPLGLRIEFDHEPDDRRGEMRFAHDPEAAPLHQACERRVGPGDQPAVSRREQDAVVRDEPREPPRGAGAGEKRG